MTGVITKTIKSGESKTTLVDYLRQAKNFASWNIDYFYKEILSELTDLSDCLPDCKDEMEVTERVWNLCQRHGKQVQMALCRMRDIHDNPYSDLEKNSLLHLVFAGREHLLLRPFNGSHITRPGSSFSKGSFPMMGTILWPE